MELGKPSRTAWAAAAHRAAHQILEQGRIFSDPLAMRILGEDSEAIVRRAEENPASRRMRIFIALRTRFAEDALAAAVAQGVRQLVVLGAGLDTYAYRSTWGNQLRIFEVDHPATQGWKRQRLAEVAIPLPDSLTFTPVDFERHTLDEGLAAAGFDSSQQTFFTWLGVVPYLTTSAIWSTLGFIASIPNGAHVVFDYGNPPASLSPELQIAHQDHAARVAEIGEPWLTYFEADELHEQLRSLGFGYIEDLGPRQIASRYFPVHAAAAQENGGHVLRASAKRFKSS